MMAKFDKFVSCSSKWLNVIAGIGMVYVFIISFADILMNKIFKDPLNFAFDSIGLFAVVAIAAAVPQVQKNHGHIEVDFVEKRLGRIPRKIAGLLVSFLSILLWAIVAWRSFVYGSDILRAGEVSMSVGWPIYPFIWFMGVCAIFVVFVLIIQAITNFKDEPK